jgi:DNA repair protein RadC
MSPRQRTTHTHQVREASVIYRQTGTEVLPGPVTNSDAAAAYARAALPTDDAREHFAAIAVDTKHRPIGHYLVSVGTIDAALVHPREVFRFAVLAGAAGVILAHTHPSGNPAPSREDDHLTCRMVNAGQLIGIRVLDHLIIGCTYGRPEPAPAFSYQQTGRLPQPAYFD